MTDTWEFSMREPNGRKPGAGLRFPHIAIVSPAHRLARPAEKHTENLAAAFAEQACADILRLARCLGHRRTQIRDNGTLYGYGRNGLVKQQAHHQTGACAPVPEPRWPFRASPRGNPRENP